MQKKWYFLDKNIDETFLYVLTELFKISPTVGKVLINRGIKDAVAAKIYLDKDLSGLHDPFLLKGVDKAVQRIKSAIKNGEKITVYGDYDVDGITATALLVDFFKTLGGDVNYYIPDRIDEGYGINIYALDKIAMSGTKLVVTVDSGITAIEEADYAKGLGLDLIITDHHQCREQLPDAVAVINPKRFDCSYPFKDLSGVGIAFKLACAISGNVRNMLYKYGDIVSLGTIADVVSLMDENRIIVDFGLSKIQKNPNPGIREVLNTAGVYTDNVDVMTLSYAVAPRINAAGRVGDVLKAVELLLTDDLGTANMIARELDEENRNRQEIEQKILKEAMQIIEQGDYSNKKVIVLAKEGWHHGIIGIVASRISEKFNKACILISVENSTGKGSGRSIKGLNLFDALCECSDLLIKFGGHSQAAGLNIKAENIGAFDAAINRYVDTVLNEEDMQPCLYIDCEIAEEDLGLRRVLELDRLKPFGTGNAMPVFALMDAKITAIKQLTNGKHVKFVVKKGDTSIEAIGFSMGELYNDFKPGDSVDVAGNLSLNVYNAQTKVQLLLKDIRPSVRRHSADKQLSYEDLRTIYRYIRAKSKSARLRSNASEFCRSFTDDTNLYMDEKNFYDALLIFEESGLLNIERKEEYIDIEIVDMKGKRVDITKSDTYRKIVHSQ